MNAALDDKRSYTYGTVVADAGTGAPTLTQPHTLTKAAPTVGADQRYTYDPTGNTETRQLGGGSQSLQWTAENKVSETDGFGDGAGAVTGMAGKCADVESSGTADGTPIQIYACNNTNAQKWKLKNGALSTLGKCAQTVIVDPAWAPRVRLYTCNGGADQTWQRRADGSFYNPASDRCLAIPSSNSTNGTDLITWACGGQDDQHWTVADRTTYVYDAEGNRILEYSAAGSVLYLGETEVATDPNGKVIRASRTYGHPGAPSVVRVAAFGSSTGHKLSVLLNDPLGTATTSVEESSGQPYTRRAFKPYGEVRGTRPTNWPNGRGYLGSGIDDVGTGLTHLGAREYDQSTGHFLSADPLIDMADPLQINGYAYANNSPVTKGDPDGLQPIECWEGVAVCSGGKIVGAKEPEEVKQENTLSRRTVGNKDVIYDERGVPHTVGQRTSNISEQISFDYMNDDLRNAGKFYDSKTGNGSEYLWQTDQGNEAVLPKKGLVHDANGNHRAAGTTADFVKVTYKNGKIISVETWDANESNAAKFDPDLTAATVRRKADPLGEHQSQNVVYVAKSIDEARVMQEKFAGNANVRIIYPDGAFDTHRLQPLIRKFNGGTIRINPGEAPSGSLPEAGIERAPRSGGGGSRLGEIMGAAGALGDILWYYDAYQVARYGCDGMYVPCSTMTVD